MLSTLGIPSTLIYIQLGMMAYWAHPPDLS